MVDRPPLCIGYWLSSEEHGPRELVRNSARAEEAGFELAGISDHFHPWVPNQGQSPFVWAVLGGIAGVTTKLTVTTGVTAPIIRMHPAVVAHAAATAAVPPPPPAHENLRGPGYYADNAGDVADADVAEQEA